MFEKFGEFDSAEELNRAAEAQRKEGDEEALFALAEENGIDREDAEDFMDQCVPVLATTLMAAVGKLKVEAEELKVEGVLMDWTREISIRAMNEVELAEAVRRKGKSLAGYLAKLADEGFIHKAEVHKNIVSMCGSDIKKIVGNNPFYIGVPDKATRNKIMTAYYLGK